MALDHTITWERFESACRVINLATVAHVATNGRPAEYAAAWHRAEADGSPRGLDLSMEARRIVSEAAVADLAGHPEAPLFRAISAAAWFAVSLATEWAALALASPDVDDDATRLLLAPFETFLGGPYAFSARPAWIVSRDVKRGWEDAPWPRLPFSDLPQRAAISNR